MIPLLPRWNLNPNRSSFYDRDSGTLLELAAKLHSTMNELIEDYNKFIGDITEKLSKFEQDSTADRELFETGLRQEFQDFIDVVDLKIANIEKNVSSDYIDELSERITNLEIDYNTGLVEVLALAKEINGD